MMSKYANSIDPNYTFPHTKIIQSQFLLKRRCSNNENAYEKFLNRKKIILNSRQAIKQQNSYDITCPICLDILVRTTVTSCGHSFCEICLFESLLRNSVAFQKAYQITQVCPICRNYIRSQQFLYSYTFDAFIEEKIKQSKNNEIAKKQYFQKKTEWEKWNDSRKLNDVQIGKKIDVLDTEYIWCIGIIMDICEKSNELLIHYQGWSKIYDEYIEKTSFRVAPLGMFTNRKDIPSYLKGNSIDSSQNNVEGNNNQSYSDQTQPQQSIFSFLRMARLYLAARSLHHLTNLPNNSNNPIQEQ